MADRSDDIKQLFAHLGLNPGDYQELRGRTRVGTPAEAAAVASKIEPFMPVAAPVAAAPPSAVQPVVSAPPRAAAVIPKPPVILPPPVGQSASTQPPAPEASQRWSLLQAAGRTPPQVAQISPVPVARPAPPQESVIPVVQKPPVPLTRSVDLSDLPTMPPMEERPTQALFAELQRVSQRRSSANFSATDWAQNAAKPVEAATPPSSGLMALPVRDKAMVAPPATSPMAAASVSPAAPVRPPVPVVVSRPVPTYQAVTPPAFAAGQTGDSLVGTFKRLVQPARQPSQASGRLRLNYGKRGHAAAPSNPSQIREENLGDVFSRISTPPRAR